MKHLGWIDTKSRQTDPWASWHRRADRSAGMQHASVFVVYVRLVDWVNAFRWQSNGGEHDTAVIRAHGTIGHRRWAACVLPFLVLLTPFLIGLSGPHMRLRQPQQPDQ